MLVYDCNKIVWISVQVVIRHYWEMDSYWVLHYWLILLITIHWKIIQGYDTTEWMVVTTGPQIASPPSTSIAIWLWFGHLANSFHLSGCSTLWLCDCQLQPSFQFLQKLSAEASREGGKSRGYDFPTCTFFPGPLHTCRPQAIIL